MTRLLWGCSTARSPSVILRCGACVRARIAARPPSLTDCSESGSSINKAASVGVRGAAETEAAETESFWRCITATFRVLADTRLALAIRRVDSDILVVKNSVLHQHIKQHIGMSGARTIMARPPNSGQPMWRQAMVGMAMNGAHSCFNLGSAANQ